MQIKFSRAFITLKETYRSHYRILRPCSYLFYDSILRANEEDEAILYKMAEWDGLPTKVLTNLERLVFRIP